SVHWRGDWRIDFQSRRGKTLLGAHLRRWLGDHAVEPHVPLHLVAGAPRARGSRSALLNWERAETAERRGFRVAHRSGAYSCDASEAAAWSALKTFTSTRRFLALASRVLASSKGFRSPRPTM